MIAVWCVSSFQSILSSKMASNHFKMRDQSAFGTSHERMTAFNASVKEPNSIGTSAALHDM